MVPVAPVTRMLMENLLGGGWWVVKGTGERGDGESIRRRSPRRPCRCDGAVAVAFDGGGDVAEAARPRRRCDHAACPLATSAASRPSSAASGLHDEPQASAGLAACWPGCRATRCRRSTPLRRQHLPRAVEHLAADVVEHQVDVARHRFEALRPVVDDVVSAQRCGPRRCASVAAVAMTSAPARLANCDGDSRPVHRPRHATRIALGRPRGPARCRLCQAARMATGSDAAVRSSSAWGVRRQIRLVDGDQFGIGARAPPSGPITRSPTAKREAPGPTASTTPASSMPSTAGRCDREGVADVALAHLPVEAVEAGGPNAHQHLAGLRDWGGDRRTSWWPRRRHRRSVRACTVVMVQFLPSVGCDG